MFCDRSTLAQAARRLSPIALFVGCTIIAGPATAQDFFTPAAGPGAFPAERFSPGTDRESVFDAESGAVHGHLDYDVALWGLYALNPLVAWDRPPDAAASRLGSVVAHRLGANLVAQLSLFEWIALGIDIPVALQLPGEVPATVDAATPAAVGLGDLRVVPKIRLLRAEDAEIDVAVIPSFTLHTAFPRGAYLGEGFATFAPRIALSRELERFRFAADVGLLVRSELSEVGQAIGPQFTYRAGIGYKLHPVGVPVGLDLGVSGSAQIAPGSNEPGRQPLEALAGVYYDIWGPLQAFAGAGAGLLAGPGAPDLRVFGGLRWSARAPKDKDGDGVDDYQDSCPDQPEDIDGFEDADGCVDADNDGDGVLDAGDRCPDEAEDIDGFEDDDGCPDLDNDGDGVADGQDKCPDEAEDVDEFEDADGCVDPDNDGDGILDGSDECPTEAEDRDGFEDEDGCVDADDDGDGVADVDDGCRTLAEDADGFEDEDGCPDPDNDGDSVLDADDKCPLEKEVINGVDDDDGCPDKGKAKVIVTAQSIDILEKVFFATGKADIGERSFSLLSQVAAVLRANPQIRAVRVEGHTDSVGNGDSNRELSQRRADAVRAFLLNKGVAPTRLLARGFGDTQPIADNGSRAGRDQNRRVEFKIVALPDSADGDDDGATQEVPAVDE